MIVLLSSLIFFSEFYRFLKMRKSLFFLFAGKTVRIELATSLFII